MVKGYRIEGGQLYLLSSDGRALLEFVLASSSEAAQKPIELLDTGLTNVLRDGHLRVPMRPVLDWLGAKIGWDAATQTAVGTRGDRRLEITVGSAEARIAGGTVALPTAAFELNGRAYIPLTLLGDPFGVVVEPSPGTHTVTLVDESASQATLNESPMPAREIARWQGLLDTMVDPNDVLRRSAPGAALLVEPVGRFRGSAGIGDLNTRTPVKATDGYA